MDRISRLRAQAGIYQRSQGRPRGGARKLSAATEAIETARESARKCRARKKSYIALLEQQVVELATKVDQQTAGGQTELATKVKEQAEQIEALRDQIARQDVTVGLLLGAFD
jgi:uncharacterized protein with WD repeat